MCECTHTSGLHADVYRRSGCSSSCRQMYSAKIETAGGHGKPYPRILQHLAHCSTTSEQSWRTSSEDYTDRPCTRLAGSLASQTASLQSQEAPLQMMLLCCCAYRHPSVVASSDNLTETQTRRKQLSLPVPPATTTHTSQPNFYTFHLGWFAQRRP